MTTKKNIFLWALYDFANSIIAIVFFLYFAQWIVTEQGVSDFRFNLTFTITAVMLLFTVPITGSILDKFVRRITGVRVTTIFTILFYTLCAVAVLKGHATVSLVFFTLGMYSYLLSFTFYTPLINDISPPQRRGLISGIGISANYLGQFTGLAIALPFSKGLINFFGASPRAETLLPSIILFALLALPMLLFFYEPKQIPQKIFFKREIVNLWHQTRSLFIFPGVALFMIAYFLFNDAILTAANNFPIFLEQVWGVSDTIKSYLLISIVLTSAIGGTVSGFLADKFDHKRTLVFVLCGWVVILPFVAYVTNLKLLFVATSFMGFWFGANWAVSRSVMAYLAPPKKHNLAFAYFGLAERASSFVGPIVWGLVVTNLISLGSDRYRLAVLAITGFIVIGLFVLSKVRSDRVSPSSATQV